MLPNEALLWLSRNSNIVGRDVVTDNYLIKTFKNLFILAFGSHIEIFLALHSEIFPGGSQGCLGYIGDQA